MTCYCPLDDILDRVAKKYGMQIIALLGADGPLRYGTLKDRLEATSDSVLAKRLDELEDAALIERHSYDEIPPRVEYSLTSKGRDLEARLQSLREWATHVDD